MHLFKNHPKNLESICLHEPNMTLIRFVVAKTLAKKELHQNASLWL